MRWVLAGILLAVVSSIGCLDRAYCGMAWESEADWVQADVFATFPTTEAAPQRYAVWWTYEHEYVPDGGPTKGGPPPSSPPGFDAGNVTRKDAMGETTDWRVRLTALPDGNVSWQVSAHEDRSEAWTRARLTATFTDLGLPPPTAPGPSAWKHVC